MPINEMFCGGAVTYTTTISPSDGQVDDINRDVHNITGLRTNTLYLVTTVALRSGIRIHEAILNVSTPQSLSK